MNVKGLISDEVMLCANPPFFHTDAPCLTVTVGVETFAVLTVVTEERPAKTFA